MSDFSKAEKLAAARKKFEQLKKEKDRHKHNEADTTNTTLGNYFPEPASIFDQIPAPAEPTISQKDEGGERGESQHKSIINYEQHIYDLQEENARLRYELQLQVQSAGILVGEKTELIESFNQVQSNHQQKVSECEELQARLRTSRSRVVDIERELTALKKQIENHSGNQDKILSDINALRKENDELFADLSEHRQRVHLLTEENVQLSTNLEITTSKLANLIQSDVNNSDTDRLTEELRAEKLRLTKQLNELSEQLSMAHRENEDAKVNYQQYTEQLNSHMSNLAYRVEQLEEENEQLRAHENDRIVHISALEKQLQSKGFNVNDPTIDDNKRHFGSDNTILNDELMALRNEVKTLKLERDSVAEELLLCKQQMADLQHNCEVMQANQFDSGKLLSDMESDKVALATCMAQNNDLKSQLEALRRTFDDLNSEQMCLSEMLERERRTHHDVLEKLQHTELRCKRLEEAIEMKDAEMRNMQRFQLENEQLYERLHQYENADGAHTANPLQAELNKAHQTIHNLEAKLADLRLSPMSNHFDTTAGNVEPSHANSTKASLLEVAGMTPNLESNSDCPTSASQNPDTQNQGTQDVLAKDNIVNKESDEYCGKISQTDAMAQLEEKFRQVMSDLANLTDEKQRLEHLVFQLQYETEAIGEYVSLYQHQRSVLKEKAKEREQQLLQLNHDRQLIKVKLEQLRGLVERMVNENDRHHTIGNNISQANTCQEHSNLVAPADKDLAEQIIKILAEIKGYSIVNNCSYNSNSSDSSSIQPCPWCSGQLLTV